MVGGARGQILSKGFTLRALFTWTQACPEPIWERDITAKRPKFTNGEVGIDAKTTRLAFFGHSPGAAFAIEALRTFDARLVRRTLGPNLQ
jgi:hypothetical protein